MWILDSAVTHRQRWYVDENIVSSMLIER